MYLDYSDFGLSLLNIVHEYCPSSFCSQGRYKIIMIESTERVDENVDEGGRENIFRIDDLLYASLMT